jgi:hypothetical protein
MMNTDHFLHLVEQLISYINEKHLLHDYVPENFTVSDSF